ncbi:hypothetical protein [Streptomyces roseoviridis]|uniref:Uncharacterized protein n=1 Tax=Streptomyces roseoviridis TaxID=67361 RepID=A0ABV5QY56_9ACTN
MKTLFAPPAPPACAVGTSAGMIVLLLSAWMLWRFPVRRLTAMERGAQ